MRLNADGSTDPTYAGGGTSGDGIARDVPGNHNIGARLFAQSDGGVLMVTSASRADSDIVLVRFDADGMPVESFGEKGVARIDLGGDESLLHAAITGDGKVVLTGHSSIVGEGHRSLIARVLPDGSLASKSAGGGVIFSPREFLGETGYIDVATDAAGRTFSVGRSTVWCFAPDGTPDTSFGDGGALQFPDKDFTP